MHKFERLEVWSLAEVMLLREAYQASDKLAAKLQAMRRTITGTRSIHEGPEEYILQSGTPFDELNSN